MLNFKDFLLETEETDNVKSMIRRLPKKHSKLLDGYRFKYQPGNTLKGDKENIGQIDQDKITVAAPWNYGREFTTLHEIAHLVWEYLMTPQLKKKWEKILKKTQKEQIQSVKQRGQSAEALKQCPEEIFCMAYANCYVGTPVVKYDHPAWTQFIKSLPR
jgi:hypothetical protein